MSKYTTLEIARSEFLWTTGFIGASLLSIVGADYLISTASSYSALRPLSSYGHIIMGAAVVIASLFISSPYGRHTSKAAIEGKITTLPAVRSWIIQESPTLMAFAYFNIKYGLAPITLNPAMLLFATHYLNRCLVFPLLLGKGTPQPVWVTFSALCYCVFNGLLQNGIDASEVSSTSTSASSSLSAIADRIENPVLALVGVALFATGMSCKNNADRHHLSHKEKAGT
jgi:hypothetical protein